MKATKQYELIENYMYSNWEAISLNKIDDSGIISNAFEDIRIEHLRIQQNDKKSLFKRFKLLTVENDLSFDELKEKINHHLNCYKLPNAVYQINSTGLIEIYKFSTYLETVDDVNVRLLEYVKQAKQKLENDDVNFKLYLKLKEQFGSRGIK